MITSTSYNEFMIQDNHQHMVHMFAPIMNPSFAEGLPAIHQIPFQELNVSNITLNEAEYHFLRLDIIMFVVDMVNSTPPPPG